MRTHVALNKVLIITWCNGKYCAIKCDADFDECFSEDEKLNFKLIYEAGIETEREYEAAGEIVERANREGRKLVPSEIEAALLAA